MNAVWIVLMSWSRALLIDVWHSMRHSIIDTAINQCRKWLRACMHAKQTNNILNTYCELIKRLKKLWTSKLQLSLFILKKMFPYHYFCNFQGLKVFQGNNYMVAT